jgi:hypothetical protein
MTVRITREQLRTRFGCTWLYTITAPQAAVDETAPFGRITGGANDGIALNTSQCTGVSHARTIAKRVGLPVAEDF